MKDSEKRATEVEAELKARDAARTEQVEKEYDATYSNKQDAQNTTSSFHDSVIRRAVAHNREKLMTEVDRVVIQAMLERKALVRQMEQIDLLISQCDAKLEQLTHLVETDQIIEASEVRAFMSGEYSLVAIDMGAVEARVVAALGGEKLGNIDLGYSEEKARVLKKRI